MTRQRFEGLRLELCRRIWIKEKGTAKGFLKGGQLRDTKINFKENELFKSYNEIWNNTVFKILRESVGM